MPGPLPRYTVAGLIGRNEAGRVTKIAFGVVRALDYLSIALMIGGLLFMQAAWGPALGELAGRRSVAGRRPRPRSPRRAGRLLVAAVLLGLLVSVLGILLQGATRRRGVAVEVAESDAHRRARSKVASAGCGLLRALDWLLLGVLLLAVSAEGGAAGAAGGAA